ncbi:MAG: phosphatase PAP2 family protein [Thermoleophilia bacterium]
MDRRTPLPAAAAAFIALTALSAAALAALYAVAIRTEWGQIHDEMARGNLHREDAPRVYRATTDLLDSIHISSLAVIGAVIVGLALLRRRPRLALGAAVLIAGANISAQILKAALPRPDLHPDPWVPTSGTFPSGHVTVAMSLAAALLLVAPAVLRWPVAALGAAYAAGVGVAVITLDWHRPSDVLGAYLLTAAWTGVVAAVLSGPAGRGELADGIRSPRTRLLAAAATVAAVGIVITVTVAVGRDVDVFQVEVNRPAFAAAATACAITGAALCALIARLRGASVAP